MSPKYFQKTGPFVSGFAGMFCLYCITNIFGEHLPKSHVIKIFTKIGPLVMPLFYYLMDSQHLLISPKILAENVTKILEKTFVTNIFARNFCKNVKMIFAKNFANMRKRTFSFQPF